MKYECGYSVTALLVICTKGYEYYDVLPDLNLKIALCFYC